MVRPEGQALMLPEQAIEVQTLCGDTTDNADPCTALAGGSIVVHKN